MPLRTIAVSAAILASLAIAISLTTVSAKPDLVIAETSAAEAGSASAHADTGSGDRLDFVIAGGDGYGATECLASPGQCGKIVADAWCESKGYARSLAYRGAGKDETTASTGRSGGEQAFVITCAAK